MIFFFVVDYCVSSVGKVKILVYCYYILVIVYVLKMIVLKCVDMLVSQIDLLLILFVMFGLQSDDYFVGCDILCMVLDEGWVLLLIYQNFGYLKGDVMMVLQFWCKIEIFKISVDGKEVQLMLINL